VDDDRDGWARSSATAREVRAGYRVSRRLQRSSARLGAAAQNERSVALFPSTTDAGHDRTQLPGEMKKLYPMRPPMLLRRTPTPRPPSAAITKSGLNHYLISLGTAEIGLSRAGRSPVGMAARVRLPSRRAQSRIALVAGELCRARLLSRNQNPYQ